MHLDKNGLLNKAYQLLRSSEANVSREWYRQAEAEKELAWAYIGLADRLSGAQVFQVVDRSDVQDV